MARSTASQAAGQPGHGRALGRRAGLQGPVARPFQGAIGLGQLAGEVAVQGVLGRGDVGDGLLGRAQQRPLLGQAGFLALAGVEAIEFGQAEGQFLGLGGGAAGEVAELFAPSRGRRASRSRPPRPRRR
jgi:hypothetical protein